MPRIDLAKPYHTRDGREAGASRAPNGRLHGWIMNMDKSVGGATWNEDGSIRPGEVDPSDLVNQPGMAPEPTPVVDLLPSAR